MSSLEEQKEWDRCEAKRLALQEFGIESVLCRIQNPRDVQDDLYDTPVLSLEIKQVDLLLEQLNAKKEGKQ